MSESNADSVPVAEVYVAKVQPNCARGDHAWCSLSMLCACLCHDLIPCSECIDLGMDDGSAILRPFGKVLQCRRGHTVLPEESNDGSSP